MLRPNLPANIFNITPTMLFEYLTSTCRRPLYQRAVKSGIHYSPFSLLPSSTQFSCSAIPTPRRGVFFEKFNRFCHKRLHFDLRSLNFLRKALKGVFFRKDGLKLHFYVLPNTF